MKATGTEEQPKVTRKTTLEKEKVINMELDSYNLLKYTVVDSRHQHYSC